jgi:putative Holliday junction resolvase
LSLARTAPALPPGTLLAFDFGGKRIGVAVGESATRIAHPLTVISTQANEERLAAIGALVSEWRPSGLVVGLPRHRDGREHEIVRLAEKFARRLQVRFGLPVAFVDETLTSVEAQARIREAGGSRAGAESLDSHAAAVILQNYLDAGAATAC